MIKDLGKLKYFIGIKVIDNDKGICLNQRKYVLDLLSGYGMLACKPVKTPLLSKLVIFNEATNNDPILDNITNYQKLMDILSKELDTMQHKSLVEKLCMLDVYKVLTVFGVCSKVGGFVLPFAALKDCYDSFSWDPLVVRSSLAESLVGHVDIDKSVFNGPYKIGWVDVENGMSHELSCFGNL
ncbi:ribonuclease H-like domain-containing protein [Tanacetum coccineum]